MNTEYISIAEQPLISVAVPLYNHSKYIEQCLNSIRDNGWKRIELILIDDGSIDHSYAIVNSWLLANAHCLEKYSVSKQQNLGITKTLNKLISQCTGDFIVLVASDDYLLENSIQERYDYLNENKTKLAVFTDAIGIDDDGVKICSSVIQERFHGHINNLVDEQKIAKELILNWCVPGPVFMARKEAYQEMGLYDEQYFIEDRYFYLKLLTKDRIGFLAKSLSAYRIHTASITGNKAKQIAVGLEILKIEKGLLNSFSGINKFYLQLQMWSNYSQVHNSNIKILLIIRCIISKVLKRALQI
jgi:alpha-1,3-rhamnosyltransferase